MFFRVFAEFVQLVLQFDDRLLEIELMFHAFERITGFGGLTMRIRRALKMRKAGLASGLRGDEVYTPSPRRSEGRRDQLGGRCPSRAASKTPMPTLNGQRNPSLWLSDVPSCNLVQRNLIFFPVIFAAVSFERKKHRLLTV